MLAVINPTGDLARNEQAQIAELRRLFPGPDTAILVGPKATKAAMKETARERAHLYFSGHGSFNLFDPDASGLALAGGEWLRLPEIAADLDLSFCEWAMLVACETGMADVETAPEESISLALAIQQAGARFVTATFWSVEENSATLFAMKAYERHRRDGLTPPQATREAALSLCHGSAKASLLRHDIVPRDATARSEPTFAELLPDEPEPEADAPTPKEASSPLYWAAFACWGNMKNSDFQTSIDMFSA